jgi:hypothetical protein
VSNEEAPFLPNTSSTETAAILSYQQRYEIEKIALRQLVSDQKQRRQDQLKENDLLMTHDKDMVNPVEVTGGLVGITGDPVKANNGPVGVSDAPVVDDEESYASPFIFYDDAIDEIPPQIDHEDSNKSDKKFSTFRIMQNSVEVYTYIHIYVYTYTCVYM